MDTDPLKKNDGRFKKGVYMGYGFKKGQVSPLKGKKMSEDWKAKLRKPKSITHPASDITKKKISIALRGKYVGKDNWNWKGGGSHIEHGKRRREKVRNAEGSHTQGEWELLKIQYGFTCPCCKQQEPTIKLTEDHIIPLSKGGSNFIENIQPLCLRCNVKKFTKIIKY
jgi:hypothetical protein